MPPQGRERNWGGGCKVITGTMEDLSADKCFDVITFLDVMEHLANVQTALISAHKLLNNKGVLAICTPDSRSLIAKLSGKFWHCLMPPEHLIIFNRHNLKDLLLECGFQVLYTGKIGRRFTLQYTMQIAANLLKSALLTKVAKFLKNNSWGKLSLAINLRDNIFIIAKKL